VSTLTHFAYSAVVEDNIF